MRHPSYYNGTKPCTFWLLLLHPHLSILSSVSISALLDISVVYFCLRTFAHATSSACNCLHPHSYTSYSHPSPECLFIYYLNIETVPLFNHPSFCHLLINYVFVTYISLLERKLQAHWHSWHCA